MKKTVIIFFVLITFLNSFGQSDTASKFDFSIKLSPTITNANKANKYYGYKGNSYYGSNVRFTVGRKVSNSLKFSTGFDFSTYKFYSNPFYKNRPYYLGSQYMINTDTYESVSFYHQKLISIPILFEYSLSKKRIKPLFGFGLLFSTSYYQNRDDIRKSTLLDSSVFYSLGNNQGHSWDLLKARMVGFHIFGTANIGLSARINNFNLSLSIDYTSTLFNSRTNRNSIGLNLGINKPISSTKFPHKVHSDSSKKVKRNLLYLEIFGYGYYYSFNYERVLALGKNLALSARIGTTLLPISYNKDEDYSKYFLPHTIPLGINAELGKKREFLFGIGYTFSIGDYVKNKKPLHISLGSTIVTKRNNFFRFLLTPRMEAISVKSIEPWLGISFGRKF